MAKVIKTDLTELGFVQVNRSIMRSAVFANPDLFRTYMWCCFKATFKAKVISLKISQGYTEVSLKKGEFVTGRFSGADELGINPTTYWSWLKKIEKYGLIEIKSTRNYSIIRVVELMKIKSE